VPRRHSRGALAAERAARQYQAATRRVASLPLAVLATSDGASCLLGLARWGAGSLVTHSLSPTPGGRPAGDRRPLLLEGRRQADTNLFGLC